jgi:hypothetical protein
MAALLINLLPYMQKTAQEFSLNNICRLCTLNNRNQLKSCKNSLLLNLIKLLNDYNKFTSKSMEKLFRTIQILGRCSMSQRELKQLVELLQPSKRFPYGIHILRCFIVWSKFTTSVGSNLGFLSSSNYVELSSSNENILLLNGSSGDSKPKPRSNSLTINQTALMNMLRTTGTGALSANAQQQAKYFFDFQHSNSVSYLSQFCLQNTK